MFDLDYYRLCRSYYPETAVTASVWAISRSLATTWEITVVFSSSGYLDVSVPRVCLLILKPAYHVFNVMGCPIRTSADQSVIASPRSFSQLITSFFASESLGILHTLFILFFKVFFLTKIRKPLYDSLSLLFHIMSMNFLSTSPSALTSELHLTAA